MKERKLVCPSYYLDSSTEKIALDDLIMSFTTTFLSEIQEFFDSFNSITSHQLEADFDILMQNNLKNLEKIYFLSILCEDLHFYYRTKLSEDTNFADNIAFLYEEANNFLVAKGDCSKIVIDRWPFENLISVLEFESFEENKYISEIQEFYKKFENINFDRKDIIYKIDDRVVPYLETEKVVYRRNKDVKKIKYPELPLKKYFEFEDEKICEEKRKKKENIFLEKIEILCSLILSKEEYLFHLTEYDKSCFVIKDGKLHFNGYLTYILGVSGNYKSLENCFWTILYVLKINSEEEANLNFKKERFKNINLEKLLQFDSNYKLKQIISDFENQVKLQESVYFEFTKSQENFNLKVFGDFAFKFSKENIKKFLEFYKKFFYKIFRNKDFLELESLCENSKFYEGCIEKDILIPCVYFIEKRVKSFLGYDFSLKFGVVNPINYKHNYKKILNFQNFKSFLKFEKKKIDFKNFANKTFEKEVYDFNLENFNPENEYLFNKEPYEILDSVIYDYFHPLLPENNVFLRLENCYVCISSEKIIVGEIKIDILNSIDLKGINPNDFEKIAYFYPILFLIPKFRNNLFKEIVFEEHSAVFNFENFTIKVSSTKKNNENYLNFPFEKSTKKFILEIRNQKFCVSMSKIKEFVRFCNVISEGKNLTFYRKIEYKHFVNYFMKDNEIKEFCIFEYNFIKNHIFSEIEKLENIFAVEIENFTIFITPQKIIPANLFLKNIIQDLPEDINFRKYISAACPLIKSNAIPNFYNVNTFIYFVDKPFWIFISEDNNELILKDKERNKSANLNLGIFIKKEMFKKRFKRIISFFDRNFFSLDEKRKYNYCHKFKNINFEFLVNLEKNKFSIQLINYNNLEKKAEIENILKFLFEFEFNFDLFFNYINNDL